VTIEAGAASGTEEKLIHFEKMTMIYETLSVLKRCFEVSYSEAMIESIAAGEGTKGEGTTEELQWMLKVLPRLPEKELYEFKGDSKKKVVPPPSHYVLPCVLMPAFSINAGQGVEEGVQDGGQG
jgi:hypothetical protein